MSSVSSTWVNSYSSCFSGTVLLLFALIVCCNEFNAFGPAVPVGDVDWIYKNCVIVELPKKEVWYIKEHSDDDSDEP